MHSFAVARQPFLRAESAATRYREETGDASLGPEPWLDLDLGREVLLDERGKKDQGQLPHPHRLIAWLAQSAGARSHLGGGRGDVGKQLPSPPRLHLHQAGDGNYPSAIFVLEKWQRGCSKLPLF